MKPVISISCSLVLLLAIIIGCHKTTPVSPSSNMDLSTKPLSELKAVLAGTWQLHYLKGGFCGVCEYQRDNEFYTFGPNDDIKWTIDKNVMADTTIGWFQQQWQGKTINVMDFYANDMAHHLLSPGCIRQDTLELFEPGPDGMRYYLTRVK